MANPLVLHRNYQLSFQIKFEPMYEAKIHDSEPFKVKDL
jgi:hypothetical protein